MRELSEEKGKSIEDVLIEAYLLHGSQKSAAAALGISQPTFSLWTKLLRLETRTVTVLSKEGSK